MTTGKFYTLFIVLFILFGLLFYSYLDINLVDEILVAILAGYMLLIRLSTHRSFPKEFAVYVLIISGYIIYSFFLDITSSQAILYDVQQQVKPFLAFYATIYLTPTFSKLQMKVIQTTCIIAFFIALCFIPNTIMTNQFMGGHITTLASLSMILFCIRYYFKRDREKLSLAFLSLGLFSGRAKFFTSYAIAMLFLSLHRRIKIMNIKFIILVCIIIICMVYFVIWDKFNFYFIQGTEEDSGIARPMFYVTAWHILWDYFPLGSGFATFANHASRVFYSPLYYNYNLWMIRGVTPDNPIFIGDTFYPGLAQFGFIGIVLFFVFFYRRYKEICSIRNLDVYILGLIILVTILFESVADTTILSNRGVIYFILLGLLHNENMQIRNRDSV